VDNLILGLDVSLTSLGWFLQHDKNKKLLYGTFKTTPKDGIILKRIILQRDRFVNLVNEHKIEYLGIEQPFLHAFSTEILYALHQFILEVCYTRHLKIVYITPAQIKIYAVGNHLAPKNEIVFKTKEVLGLTREKINDDASDAYWVSILAKKFWSLQHKEIQIDQLSEAEKLIFIKNKSGKPGILYKENDSFFLF